MEPRVVFLFVIHVVLCFSFRGDVSNAVPHSAKSWTQLALAVSKSSYLPIDDRRFIRNGSIMENPKSCDKDFLSKCPRSRPDKDAGLCYKRCELPASWAFTKGVGPVCWGCPKSHPVEQDALCYKRCPRDKRQGRSFLCFGGCPAGYRNDGLTCFRDVRIGSSDNSRCPWYDVCGLALSRGCSRCPAGHANDGCTCRVDAHVVTRPRHNRGVGVVMRSRGRGVGRLPSSYVDDPRSDREACRVGDWVGEAFVRDDTEVIKFTNDRQKIVAFGFRATDLASIRDWSANLNVFPVQVTLKGKSLKVHRGYMDKYKNIAKWFEKAYSGVPVDYTILLTGYSLGGAEATIAAAFASGKLGRAPDVVITWGSPLTGAESFRSFYDQEVGCNATVRYVTKGDAIARMPKVFGYTHVCASVELEPEAEGFLQSHRLYKGYGEGIKRKYGNLDEIKLGCDVLKKNAEEPSAVLITEEPPAVLNNTKEPFAIFAFLK